MDDRELWMLDGLCRGVRDRTIFFPTKPNTSAGRRAKRVCEKCPVRVDCYKYAMSNNELGVWGGTDEFDRALHRVLLSSGSLTELVPHKLDNLNELVTVTETYAVDITFDLSL